MSSVRRSLATQEPTLKMLADRMLDEDAYHVRIATSQRALEKKLDYLVREHRRTFNPTTFVSPLVDFDTYEKSVRAGAVGGMTGMRGQTMTGGGMTGTARGKMGGFQHLSATKTNAPVWGR